MPRARYPPFFCFLSIYHRTMDGRVWLLVSIFEVFFLGKGNPSQYSKLKMCVLVNKREVSLYIKSIRAKTALRRMPKPGKCDRTKTNCHVLM